MHSRYERRSKEAPMDFEFTDKNRDVISMDSPFRTPVKRKRASCARFLLLNRFNRLAY